MSSLSLEFFATLAQAHSDEIFNGVLVHVFALLLEDLNDVNCKERKLVKISAPASTVLLTYDRVQKFFVERNELRVDVFG